MAWYPEKTIAKEIMNGEASHEENIQATPLNAAVGRDFSEDSVDMKESSFHD